MAAIRFMLNNRAPIRVRFRVMVVPIILIVSLSATISSNLDYLASAQSQQQQQPQQLAPGLMLSPQDMALVLQDLQKNGFTTAATLLKFLGGSVLGNQLTLLVPTDVAIANLVSHSGLDSLQYPAVLQQHLLQRSLAFSQLQLLPTNTWIPTALPGYGVQVTSVGSGQNLSLNGAQIVKPDLCASVSLSLLSCQGIDAVLNVTRPPTFTSSP